MKSLACAVVSGATVVAQDGEPGRLTPAIEATPFFNGAKVFGVRPGSPLLYRVPISGERPLRVVAKGLPAGVQLDSKTGILKGKVLKAGVYNIQLFAKNGKGAAKGSLRLVVGDQIALTPPMAWNSWYCFSEAVSDQDIRDMAKAMDESGLADFGWSYVNIDDCWQGEKRDVDGSIMSNARFPDMMKMNEYVHGLGLKAGIYSTPWMGSYAGYLGGSAPDETHSYEKFALEAEKRLDKAQIFGRFPGTAQRGMDKMGSVWLFDRDMKKMAKWGFDYIKVDWKPIDIPTTKRLSEAVRGSGRDIILSLSNEANFAWAQDYGKYAELWRTSGDIRDNWPSIATIGFEQTPVWQKIAKPGNWNDPDMLQVGVVGVPNMKKEAHHTQLLPNEQYTQVTLWAIQAAPMVLSCDLRQLDDFTKGLLMNREVIAVDQDELGVAGVKTDFDKDLTAFVKPLADGTTAVAIFNRRNQAEDVPCDLKKLGLNGTYHIRDLWRMENEKNTVSGVYSSRIGRHGVKLIRLKEVK